MSRLTRAGELEAVRLQGKRVRTGQLEVRYLASLLRHPRVGVVVPRLGHTAVDRNLVKRRLRELLRTELLPRLGSLDVVVRATAAAYHASFDELRTALLRAASELPAAGPEGDG